MKVLIEFNEHGDTAFEVETDLDMVGFVEDLYYSIIEEMDDYKELFSQIKEHYEVEEYTEKERKKFNKQKTWTKNVLHWRIGMDTFEFQVWEKRKGRTSRIEKSYEFTCLSGQLAYEVSLSDADEIRAWIKKNGDKQEL